MGKHITDIEQLYKGLGGLFNSLDQMPSVKKSVLDSNLVLGMKYHDPEGQIVIDASGDDIVVHVGECPDSVKPKIVQRLSADTAHLYWLGKMNFTIAMQKGYIKTDGDLGAILKLLPVLGPMFKMYGEFLKDNGMEELLV